MTVSVSTIFLFPDGGMFESGPGLDLVSGGAQDRPYLRRIWIAITLMGIGEVQLALDVLGGPKMILIWNAVCETCDDSNILMEILRGTSTLVEVIE